MSNIAIIPARGGSKRIPKKNVRNFCGKPIMAYSIEAALATKLFTEIMVSTDDQEIADMARRFGASVPFMRSKKNSDDHATTADVLFEVLSDYQKAGQVFDYCCCIYPTAPFVNKEKILKAFDILTRERAESVLPVVRFSYPIQRALGVDESGVVKMREPNHVNSRSQDLCAYYHDVGQFYWLKVDTFMHEKKIFLSRTYPFFVNETEAQDIDNEEDWQIAEIKYQHQLTKDTAGNK